MNFRAMRQFPGFTHAILALGWSFVFVLLLAGCKDKPTSAAPPEKHVGAPPLVRATLVSVSGWDSGRSDPLDDPVWAKANWYLLQSPMNTSRTTPPVRAAMVYDANAFYVAFVSDTVPPPASPIAQDVVAIFLDTSKAANGTETMQISVDAAGHCRCTWIRSGTPAVAKEDGSPEMSHPLYCVPDYVIKGLAATTRRTTLNGKPVWTTLVTIPFKTLPIPLQVPSPPPLGGEHWKVNLLRTITTADTGSGTQQLQANLSPVYLGAQAVSPYRMAVLELTK